MSSLSVVLLLAVVACAALAAPRPQPMQHLLQPHMQHAQQQPHRPRLMNPHARVSRFDPDQIMSDIGKMTKGFNDIHPMPAFNAKEQKLYDQTFQVMNDMASKFDFSNLYDDDE